MNSMMIVGLQFLLIAVIVIYGWFPRLPLSLSLFIAGMMLGLTSIAYMQLDNLRILPEPKENIRFITRGPYRILRHPMYTSVLLATLSFVIESRMFFPFIFWLLLLCVLLIKIRIEEKLLSQHLPEYVEYKKRTWKLIPFLF
jgi:protein-S-isoprenylcysteine O-methyltransferase Ste14